MDDMTRMLRRLSRQGVPVEGIARRLRAVRCERGEFRLRNEERLLLQALFQNDNICLSHGDWDTLRALTESAAAPPEQIRWYPYQGVQRLRVEPVMRVHRLNDL